MWTLLISELKYDKSKIITFLIFFSICIVIIWYWVKWERNRAPMILLIMLISTVMAVFSTEQRRSLTKRDRLHFLLPVAVRKIGLAHIFYPLLIWIMILVFYVVLYVVFQTGTESRLTAPSLLQIGTLTGLIIILNAGALIYRDLKSMIHKKPQRILMLMIWIVFFVSLLLPFYVVTNFGGFFGEGTELQSFLMTLSESAILSNSLAVIISLVSIKIFISRISYIDT
jgi:hypothetical protein